MFRVPDMTEVIANGLGSDLKVYDSKKKFPKTPTKGMKVRAKDTGLIFIGDGKTWVQVRSSQV